jgi:hypothetical protein
LQQNNEFFEYAVIIKNIIAYIMLSKGGINFLSKNFELTMILRNFLNTATEGIGNSEALTNISREENFYSIKFNKNIHLSKSILEHPKDALINQTIINSHSGLELNEETMLKIFYIQLKHLLEIQFVVSYFLN